jgi:ATP-binding cassette subfamily C (CFTR/MRP) protein 1
VKLALDIFTDRIIANALGIFSPAITLSIFAIISQAHNVNLDTETAFTTIAISSMVTHPANMVMTMVPRAVAAFAGFERIQSFLLRLSQQDNRRTLPSSTLSKLARDPSSGILASPDPALQIRQLRIGRKKILLDNITIEIPANSLTIISGPTGSGKSTLLRALIGEVVPVSGSITLTSRHVAYCAQKPWLPSGSIREAIYGPLDITRDQDIWYKTVTEACCLKHDFDSLTDGDQTQIGSSGLNLSGGQRQRVVCARKSYSCGLTKYW